MMKGKTVHLPFWWRVFASSESVQFSLENDDDTRYDSVVWPFLRQLKILSTIMHRKEENTPFVSHQYHKSQVYHYIYILISELYQPCPLYV